mmetsp:Transcript_9844/g.36706  ORF Transcript_9844/g.36706 Transcript_9844/m.36706 type:complete len:262 (-) Transcript_9844:31-816(-)
MAEHPLIGWLLDVSTLQVLLLLPPSLISRTLRLLELLGLLATDTQEQDITQEDSTEKAKERVQTTLRTLDLNRDKRHLRDSSLHHSRKFLLRVNTLHHSRKFLHRVRCLRCHLLEVKFHHKQANHQVSEKFHRICLRCHHLIRLLLEARHQREKARLETREQKRWICLECLLCQKEMKESLQRKGIWEQRIRRHLLRRSHQCSNSQLNNSSLSSLQCSNNKKDHSLRMSNSNFRMPFQLSSRTGSEVVLGLSKQETIVPKI